MQFRRIGQLVAATTVTAVALSGTHALAQEDTTTISVTNITDLHGHLEDGLSDPAKAGDEIGVARLQSLIKQVNEGQSSTSPLRAITWAVLHSSRPSRMTSTPWRRSMPWV